MKLFMFLQRRWTRRTGWGRIIEQRWSPPHPPCLPPSPLPHSTPAKVGSTHLNEGRERERELQGWQLPMSTFIHPHSLIRQQHASWCSQICLEEKPAQAAVDWHIIISISPSPWNLIVCCKCQTQAARWYQRLVCFQRQLLVLRSFHIIMRAWSHFVSLVWFPWHQGGGPPRCGPKVGNTIWPGQGSTWKKEMSKCQIQ